MTISFSARRHIAAPDWNRVVENSPDGWVFSLHGWQDLILRVEQWALEDHSFALREDGKLVAIMPLHFNRNTRRMSSSGWGGSGPVVAGHIGGKARSRLIRVMLDHCIAIARESDAVSFEFSVSPVTESSIENTWGVNPFCFYGFEDRSGLAQIIDLDQPESKLLAEMSADARRQIRIARDRGYTVERADWSEHLDRYYRLHEETYRRTGVQPHPKAYFSGMAAHTAPTGHSVLWAARSPGGEVVAYHNAAWFRNGAYYHTGCSASEVADDGVGYLLFWEAMLGAKKAGIRWYDAGAIFPNAWDEKQRGLTTFKTKFGGQPHRALSSCLTIREQKAQVCRSDVAEGRRRLGRLPRYALRLSKSFIVAALRVARAMRRAAFSLARHKVRFIRPYWNWREFAAVLLWSGGSGNESARLVEEFRRMTRSGDESRIEFFSSGRTALEVALRALKTLHPERSTVLLPSYGCLGIFHPIVNAGLTPQFVDIDENFLPAEDCILSQMNGETLAVLLVHLSGKGEAYSEVRARAAAMGITVIDDHCHNLGGFPGLEKTDMAIFSFSLGKNASATAGGAVVDNIGAIERSGAAHSLLKEPSSNAGSRFWHFARQYGPLLWRLFGKPVGVDSDALTARYRLFRISDLDAKLLLLQLRKLPAIIERRKRHALYFYSRIAEYPDVFHLQEPTHHIFTKMTVRLANDQIFSAFMSFMSGSGVEIEGMYRPLHLRDEVRGHSHIPLPNTDSSHSRIVNIPVRPNLTRREVSKVGNALSAFAEGVRNGRL